MFCLRGSAKDSAQHPFREWFSRIGEVRSLLPTPPILAITATASKSARRKIAKSLYMRDTKVIVQNPDRPNIKLHQQKVSSSSSLNETLAWIDGTVRTIIFTKTIKDCATVYRTIK